jgi:hypothetical protein
LASSRDTSNAPDWKDLASIIDSFQQTDNVLVAFTMGTTIIAGIPDLEIVCVWNTRERVDAGLAALGSQKLTCSGSRMKSLEAALLALLYRVDFQLALEEFEGVKKKR